MDHTSDTDISLDLAEVSEDELAAAAAVGDAEAFTELVTRLSPVLLRYLRRMIADPQAAEDVAQDTFLDAWRGLPDFGFRSSFKTWMFAIAHRKTIDYRRRRRDVPTDDDAFADLAAAAPLPADETLHRNLVDALGAELATLPRTSRAVWWLREVEGQSLGEIARILAITPGSVRGHLQRSRKYLATRLEPWRPGAGDRTGPPPQQPESSAAERSASEPTAHQRQPRRGAPHERPPHEAGASTTIPPERASPPRRRPMTDATKGGQT